MELSDGERDALQGLARSDGSDGSVSSRARIVSWWADGYSAAEIAALAGVTKPTVYKWLDRYADFGIAGLTNRPNPGKPPQVPGSVRARILALTRQSPPADTGLSHWSSREMARYLKRGEGITVSHNFIADLWRREGLRPSKLGTFKLSTDPEFESKVFDVVGLYLNPPDGAVILSYDEKTQVQALDRTQPALPIDFGKTAKRTHDYVRHGTTNLFAALNVQTGHIAADCFPRRRIPEFLRFMDRVVAQHPTSKQLHVIMDNLSTHRGTDVDAWLAKHPNVTFHYTPTGSSWLNQVEIWFGIITRQAIRRGTFTSLAQLVRRIKDYVQHWNQDAEPFEWTATAEQILGKVRILHRDFRLLLDNNPR